MAVNYILDSISFLLNRYYSSIKKEGKNRRKIEPLLAIINAERRTFKLNVLKIKVSKIKASKIIEVLKNNRNSKEK